MIKWLIYLPLNLICMLVCYTTNPIAVLFCDEVGELHGIWKMWQTWDDSCDGAFQVSCMPKFLQYDFNSKYSEHSLTLKDYNRTRYYVTLKAGATFSTKEKIQRYFCRLGWLTRNCGYGFAFYWFGETIIPALSQTIKEAENMGFGYNGKKHFLWFDTLWVYKDSRKEFSLFGYNVRRAFYLGWKFGLGEDEVKPTRVMIANRIAWRIERSTPQDGLL